MMPQGGRKFYYIERDGLVYLKRKGKKYTLPTNIKEIPFPILVSKIMSVKPEKVMYANAKIDEYPKKWPKKDDLPLRDDVTDVVKKAVINSYPRNTATAVIIRNGKVLLVKEKRGLNKGNWATPGGFLNYGESPESGLEREVFEELDISVKTKKFLGTISHASPKLDYFLVCFAYLCEIDDEKLTPSKDEVVDIEWVKPRTALERVKSPLQLSALNKAFTSKSK